MCRRIRKKLFDLIKKRRFYKSHKNLICDYPLIYRNYVWCNGENNVIRVGHNSSMINCKIFFQGTGHELRIKDGVNLSDISFWFEDSNGLIEVGSSTSMNTGCQFASIEGTRVIIGEDCMFSHNIDVRSSDSHSIIDDNGDRINPSEDIIIGNHVWIGIRSMILKGSHIADGSVVAACSLVTKSTKSKNNCILAGSPAKINKENIHWDRKRI